MSIMFNVLMIIMSMQLIECMYNPLLNRDKNCFTNITLSVSEDTITDDLDDDENIINLIATEGLKDGLNYANNRTCGWFFGSVNGTARITLKFLSFDLEQSKECARYDYVKIYRQGQGQTDWEQITTTTMEGYCGKIEPFTIEAFATNMYIEFVADKTESAKGFNATYYLTIPVGPPRITCLGVLGDETCNHNINVMEREGTELECQTEADPQAAVEWKKITANGDEVLRRGLVKSRTDDGTITLFDAQLGDQGLYKCMVKNKDGKESEIFNLTVIEKCRCPKKIRLAWYNYPPYTQYIEGFDRKQKPIFKGIFYTILENMMRDVCGACTRGHGWSEIIWSSVENRDRSLLDVKREVDYDNFDVFLPILSTQDAKEYRSRPFLPILKAPGVAFIVPKNDEGGKAIFSALWSILPVLAITVILTILAGIVVWMLDTYWNEEEFPRTFLAGIAQGAWWAYITMTTVGYGDLVPRGYLGRAFAVIWIMGGLIIISILTGAISTALTVASLENVLPLYGAKLGAVKYTEEFKLGVTRNAEMTAYDSFKEIVTAVDNGDLQGAFVDQYVTGFHTELHTLVKNSIINQDDLKYGIVLGKSISDPFVVRAFQAFIDREETMIQQAIIDNTGAVPESPVFDLMNPKGTMYVTAVLTLLGMLLIFSLAGIIFDYGYLKPKHRHILEAKNLDMLESKRVKHMAQTAQVMKDALLLEMHNFYHQMVERMDNLGGKHDFEKDHFQEIKKYNQNEIEMTQQQKQFQPQQWNDSQTQLTKVESSA